MGYFAFSFLFNPPEQFLGGTPFLLKNAEECQDNFRKSSVNCGWSRTDGVRKRNDEPQISNDGREQSAANRGGGIRWNALSSTRWQLMRLCRLIFAPSATQLAIGPSRTGIFRRSRSTTFTSFLPLTLLLLYRARRNPVCVVANKIRRSRSAPAPQPGQREKLPATQTGWRSPG